MGSLRRERTAIRDRGYRVTAVIPRHVNSSPGQRAIRKAVRVVRTNVRLRLARKCVGPPRTRLVIWPKCAPVIRQLAHRTKWLRTVRGGSISRGLVVPNLLFFSGQSCGSGDLACASGVCTSVSREYKPPFVLSLVSAQINTRLVQCQMIGGSMGLKEGCPNRSDNSCQVSCKDPDVPNQCRILSALLVDGSPCGRPFFQPRLFSAISHHTGRIRRYVRWWEVSSCWGFGHGQGAFGFSFCVYSIYKWGREKEERKR